MLDVRRLRVLSSVVTSGSISSAADNLGYSPSAVSQQIAALQRETGTVLLEKDGRGIRPTTAGLLLTEYAGRAMSTLAEAERALAELRDGQTGLLRMTYFATAGSGLIPPAVAEFRRCRSAVRLDLKLNEPAYRIRDAAEEPADIELVVLREQSSAQQGQVALGGDAQTPDRAVLVHLLDDPFRVMLRRDHPLAGKPVLDLAELADDPWVDNEFPPGLCRELMLEACSAAGFSPNFVVEADDYPMAQGFVAAGIGVTLVPELALDAMHPDVVVRRIRRPAPIRSIHAVVRASVAEHPVVRDMVRALRTAARTTKHRQFR